MASFADGLSGFSHNLVAATPEGMVSQHFGSILFGSLPMVLGVIIILMAVFMSFSNKLPWKSFGFFGALLVGYGMYIGARPT